MSDRARRYRLSGVVIESRVPLPELPAAEGVPSYMFDVVRNRRGVPRPRWFHAWQEPGGQRWASFARTPAGYVVRFPGIADFQIEHPVERGAVRHIRAAPRPAVPAETVRHLFLDQVWPLVLSASGRLVLHATAVVLPDGGALAFAGPAGAGKSSLAAALTSAGCRILSDDCLVLKKTARAWMAVPAYPGLRLWPDMLARFAPTEHGGASVAHYTSKRRLAGTVPFARRAAPLDAIYVVRRRAARGRIRVAPLTGAAALMELVPFTYVLDVEAKDQLARSFAQLAELTVTVPVVTLDVPHTPRRLVEIADLLSRRLGER